MLSWSAPCSKMFLSFSTVRDILFGIAFWNKIYTLYWCSSDAQLKFTTTLDYREAIEIYKHSLNFNKKKRASNSPLKKKHVL